MILCGSRHLCIKVLSVANVQTQTYIELSSASSFWFSFKTAQSNKHWTPCSGPPCPARHTPRARESESESENPLHLYYCSHAR